ncbi:hypothetical protein MTP99_016740 [Tenebrio molitor]|nr:hypothetical protein MTP99_016740 [Tenebrio molitor]
MMWPLAVSTVSDYSSSCSRSAPYRASATRSLPKHHRILKPDAQKCQPSKGSRRGPLPVVSCPGAANPGGFGGQFRVPATNRPCFW